ncbi:3996_t:CDS:2 [Diversispora eburnea]|uniref:3996_t:CDS:1 n=1 Tax=Diversispora eburnea TaxID=1213867 RepID=A0A9N9FMI0_9GLOM|nr:3996_t:CDS:2 [Diversispora eburnea]
MVSFNKSGKRKVVGLTTVFLIAHLISEGLLLSTLSQVNCTNSEDFKSCKKEIDHELQSNGFSNAAPSYPAMALSVTALSGIVIQLEQLYQLRINIKPLIRK